MTDGPAQSCPICRARCLVSSRGNYDDRYGYPGTFPLLKCGSCGHRFLQCDFSPERLLDLYSNYYPRSTFDVDQHQPHQESAGAKAWIDGDKASPFRWVPRGVRVLDIGCGFGESLGYYEARGCEAYGVEADDNIRRVAEQHGYKVRVGLFDPDVYEAGYFDYVTLSQVIEHVTDPAHTLAGIHRVLKPDGVAILSTPNADGWGARVFGRRWINWHAPYHLHFFTTESMRQAAEQAGLVMESVRTITSSDWLHFQWLHLLTYPATGTPSIFWAPGTTWSLKHKVARMALKVLHQLKAYHVTTRLFDALDLGDNRLYFLRKP